MAAPPGSGAPPTGSANAQAPLVSGQSVWAAAAPSSKVRTATWRRAGAAARFIRRRTPSRARAVLTPHCARAPGSACVQGFDNHARGLAAHVRGAASWESCVQRTAVLTPARLQVADPALPDCPIVFASQGCDTRRRRRPSGGARCARCSPARLARFYDMTGYGPEDVLNKNWYVSCLCAPHYADAELRCVLQPVSAGQGHGPEGRGESPRRNQAGGALLRASPELPEGALLGGSKSRSAG